MKNIIYSFLFLLNSTLIAQFETVEEHLSEQDLKSIKESQSLTKQFEDLRFRVFQIIDKDKALVISLIDKKTYLLLADFKQVADEDIITKSVIPNGVVSYNNVLKQKKTIRSYRVSSSQEQLIFERGIKNLQKYEKIAKEVRARNELKNFNKNLTSIKELYNKLEDFVINNPIEGTPESLKAEQQKLSQEQKLYFTYLQTQRFPLKNNNDSIKKLNASIEVFDAKVETVRSEEKLKELQLIKEREIKMKVARNKIETEKKDKEKRKLEVRPYVKQLLVVGLFEEMLGKEFEEENMAPNHKYDEKRATEIGGILYKWRLNKHSKKSRMLSSYLSEVKKGKESSIELLEEFVSLAELEEAYKQAENCDLETFTKTVKRVQLLIEKIP